MAETRHATATWSGDLTEGAGMIQYISSGVFSRMPITWASRTAAHNGRTSPEELLAAAHASCFSMAFSNQLAKNGTGRGATRRARRGHGRQARRPAGRSRRARSRSAASCPGIDAETFRDDRRRRQGRLPDLARPHRQRRALGRRRRSSPKLTPVFTRWGGFVYRRRRWLVVLALVIAGGFGSLAGGAADNLTTGGWLDPTSESAQVSDRLEAEYGGGRSAFIALFRSTDAGRRRDAPRRSRTRSRRPSRPSSRSTGVTGHHGLRRDAATSGSSARRATRRTS